MSYKLVALGDICTITGGGTPSKSNSSFYEGDIYWATVRDMSNDVLSKTEFKISMEAVKESSTNIIPKGNVVIATRVGLGKVCILNQDTAINQDLRGVIPKNVNQLDVKYLFYWFKSISQKIIDAGRGATVHGVTLPFIKSLEIPLPSLATQQMIVAKLDAIFAEIESAVWATEANVKNAESLWQSTLNNISTEFSGEFQELGSCVELLSGYAFKSSDYTNNLDDIPLLRGDNLGPNKIDFSEAKRFPKERFNEQVKFLLNENDIVLGMDRPLISSGLRICKISAKDTPSLLVQRVMRMRCNPSIDSDFIFLMLNSRRFISHLLGEQTGLGVPHISGKTISSFSMKIPNIATQKKIVIKLSNIFRNVRRYVNSKNTLLDKLENLRNSTLKQAFNGELVKDGK